ncbi:hypothetical protein F4801DRAFT_574895 [Xylaria longipes]|nr:hypothetical protein F4801DRAFT_574895 [Xylaria longipes]
MFRTTEYLIPNVIRQQHNRARPYANIVDLEGSHLIATFADLENWSNRVAWFLETIPSQQVLYMGPNDIRYAILLIAAIKTGKCILFPSLANQVSANQKFFETVGCKALLYAPEVKSQLLTLMDSLRGTVECVVSPTHDEMLSRDIVLVYPFDKTFDEVQHDNFLGLHTSGTSGHPKPIFWNHLAVSSLASFRDSSSGNNSSNLFRELLEGNEVLVPFPLSHFGGIGNVMATFYSDTTLILPAPGTRLTPENFTLLLQKGKCTAAAVPPSLLEAMLTYPSGMDVLAGLKHIAYTGGPLNPLRGKALAEKLPHLFTVLASTEGGVSHLVSTGDSSHWNSFKFFDVGQRMEEITPGIFELVFPRSELVERTYAFFHTHPHLDVEFRTSDLFSPLENDSGWWVYRGRADNWIAMSNGLKMDPTETEHAIASHPDISGVLMAGSHRFRLCLLIELAPKDQLGQEESDAARHERTLEELWPTIEAANSKAPRFGRVPRELVLFATPEKPFLRAGKGTVQRRLSIQAYEKEINDLYANVEEGLLVKGLALPSSMAPEDLVPFLERLCTETLLDDVTEERTISADDDLLARGLDSLSAFVLLARLKSALRKYGVDAQTIQRFDNKLLFSSTTIRQLASAVAQTVSHQHGLPDTGEPGENHYTHDISALLTKYEGQLRALVSENAKVQDTMLASSVTGEQVVVLTGSTGSLGSYILSSLLSRPSVKKIICLNRSSSAVSTQISSFRSRGLEESALEDKGRLQFLQFIPSATQLGLPDHVYAVLASEATHIIHNAYPVNFLLSIDAFAPQFNSLLEIMRLANEGRNKPHISFVSSITAAACASHDNDAPALSTTVIQERVLDRDLAASHLLHQGYARSKYVCERLLAEYSSLTGNAASILRVGQVCGPVSGTGIRFWNVIEWLPSLVLSSQFIGAVPKSLGENMDVVDWVPVDKLGEIVCDILETSVEDSPPPLIFNIVHPSGTMWSSLLPTIVRAIEAATRKPVDVVSPSEWIERLEESDHSPHVIRRNPAVKLMDFFRQTMSERAIPTTVEKVNTLKRSETARMLQPIDGAHMAEWMKGWGL